ncbi:PEP-CTERM sorting domain-containing protein [Armatimonas sp.]|uniref:PEP-CTERM sorting domain-containing protein n=1 Tax=Armatimonas sp. TaxID=1872638 RepID=UPI0037507960
MDQQTGQRESDLVGTAAVPSAYTAFDPASAGSLTDGTLYFRVRVAEDSQAVNYSGYIWVGIDANSDGAIDIFTGVNRQGSTAQNVLRNPGTGSNNSPSTTSIISTDLSPSPYIHTASNYDWAAVGAANYAGTNFDVDGGGATDYFLSFSVPFQDLVNNLNTVGSGRPTAISINQDTTLGFVIATSQQGNTINQDYNGGAISTSSSTTFASLGIITTPTTLTAQEVTVPEPETLFLCLLGLLGRRRRK